MNLPQQIYTWLVEAKILTNTGQMDDKSRVTLQASHSHQIESGYLVSQLLKKIITSTNKKIPSSLSNVKSDSSKNTKLTNWNFIWLAFEVIGLKLDTRIKELILQGQNALIVEVLRQLRERDPDKKQNSKILIKSKSSNQPKKNSSQAVDLKKINLQKDPEQSQSSLEFLIVLLKTSLGMNLQEILGLFTNQNKYLAHIIVKGVNDNYDQIVLFYTLLNKHINKLKAFHQQDNRDAEACLYAIKPGFISRNQKVAELTLDVFEQISDLYPWFVSQESKCTGTFLLGIKRHPTLRQNYWRLLLYIIEGQETEFFNKHYPISFQDTIEQVEISTYLLKFLSDSQLGEKLEALGVISSWLETATKLPADKTESQLIAFNFLGELMLYLPRVIEQNQDSLVLFGRNWDKRNIQQFIILVNELLSILERLGQKKSPMAGRIFLVISQIAKDVGAGDKLDYLILNFVRIIEKFPSIPSERLILHLQHSPLSQAQYVLICSSIQVCQQMEGMLNIATFIRKLFVDNPLLNFYLLSLLKLVAHKMIDNEDGLNFISALLEDVLNHYVNLELKYKTKPKHQKSLYLGRNGSPEKVSKHDEQTIQIKQKWKELYIALVVQMTELSIAEQNSQLKDIIQDKLMTANSNLKLKNHKVGSKAIEDLLSKRFSVNKQEQNQHSEAYRQRTEANQMQQSMMRRSKITQSSIINKLKGPDVLVKQFQTIVDKRKLQQEAKRSIQLKKQLVEEKKRISVKKQLEITNLLRGQIGQAQIREEGFLQRLMHQQKQYPLVYMDELENRQIDAIEATLKKYHRVLRHLFLLYTGTMYSNHNHNVEAIEDNQRRKEILTAVELGKILKDYRFFYLTSQPQINALIRDINVKILNKREVHDLDFKGFEQFIIQFCSLKMILPHEVAVNTPNGPDRMVKVLDGQPIYILLKEFFAQLKDSFIARREKVTSFDDIEDVPLTKEQAYEVNIFNQKINSNPSYILPKGYKKVVEKHVQFPYRFSQDIIGVHEKYELAFDALDFILSKGLNMHIMQNLAQKIVNYKVKPVLGTLGELQRQRAASTTVISRKGPLITQLSKLSKGNISNPRASVDLISEEADLLLAKKNSSIQKEKVKPKRSISLAKLAQLQKIREQTAARRAHEKQQKRLFELKQKKLEEQKRQREHDKFLKQQQAKFAEKQKKLEFQRLQKLQENEQLESKKKQNKQKFKNIHQQQIERIKKIELQTSEKNIRKKEDEQEHREKMEEQRRKLREKIEQEDKAIMEKRRDIDRKLINLFESEPIKNTFQKYQPNLKALFNFLINQTHLSLTEKKHNNEIIYDTWRYFLNAFELSPLIAQAKDVVLIFKHITRDKVVSKEYLIGLSFQQFQQALLRLAIKHKSIFNLISERIKDNLEEKPKEQVIPDKSKKGSKGSKVKDRKSIAENKQSQASIVPSQNEFDNTPALNIKQIIKEDNEGKDDIDQYGDLSKVTGKTMTGLIYYLKVPSSKVGQQERFRAVLAEKHTASIQNSNRLKQKLNQEYTLQTSPKKAPRPKSITAKIEQLGFNPTMLQKS